LKVIKEGWDSIFTYLSLDLYTHSVGYLTPLPPHLRDGLEYGCFLGKRRELNLNCGAERAKIMGKTRENHVKTSKTAMNSNLLRATDAYAR